MKSVLNFHPEAQRHNPISNLQGEIVLTRPPLTAALPVPTAGDHLIVQTAVRGMKTAITTGLNKIRIGPLNPPGLIAVNALTQTVIEGDLPVKREIYTLMTNRGIIPTIEITAETGIDPLPQIIMINPKTITNLAQITVRNVTTTDLPIIETIATIVKIETEIEITTATAHAAVAVTASRTITRKLLLLNIDQDHEIVLIKIQIMKAKKNRSRETVLLLLAQKMFMLQ
jgi:hypothetical protein